MEMSNVTGLNLDNYDLNTVLHSFVDDPNNEVRTYSESPYVTIDNTDAFLGQYKDNFSILSLNMQSLNSKFDTLLTFLSHLQDKNLSFDTVCLQETWLSKDADVSLFNIPGYQLRSHGKNGSVHSGLIIYLYDEYTYTVRNEQTMSDLWDGQFIDVCGENMKGKLTIGNIDLPDQTIIIIL